MGPSFCERLRNDLFKLQILIPCALIDKLHVFMRKPNALDLDASKIAFLPHGGEIAVGDLHVVGGV